MARTLHFIFETEAKLLPDYLLRSGKGYTEATARTEARGIADARLQNLIFTLDKVKHCLAVPGQLDAPPLTFLPPAAAAEYLWSGPCSLARQAILAAAPVLCEKCGRAAIGQLESAAATAAASAAAAAAAAASAAAVAAATSAAAAAGLPGDSNGGTPAPAPALGVSVPALPSARRMAVKTAVAPHTETAGCRTLRALMLALEASDAASGAAGAAMRGSGPDGGEPSGGPGGGGAAAAPSEAGAPGGGPSDASSLLAAAQSGLLEVERLLREADAGCLGPHSLLADVVHLAARTRRFFTASKYNVVVSPPVTLRPRDLPDGWDPAAAAARVTEKKAARAEKRSGAPGGPSGAHKPPRINCAECSKRHTGGCGTDRAKRWCLKRRAASEEGVAEAADVPPPAGSAADAADAPSEAAGEEAVRGEGEAAPPEEEGGQAPAADDDTSAALLDRSLAVLEQLGPEVAVEGAAPRDAAALERSLARGEGDGGEGGSDGAAAAPAVPDALASAAGAAGGATAAPEAAATASPPAPCAVIDDSDEEGGVNGGRGANDADSEGELVVAPSASAGGVDEEVEVEEEDEVEGSDGDDDDDDDDDDDVVVVVTADASRPGGEEPPAQAIAGEPLAAGAAPRDGSQAGPDAVSPLPSPADGGADSSVVGASSPLAASAVPPPVSGSVLSAAAPSAASAYPVFQKKYGPYFVWGQLVHWFKQPTGDPGNKVGKGRCTD